MSCKCAQLPDIVKLDDHRAIGRFDELETGDWVRLVRCPSCQHLWSVDGWDKYQTQFVVKISQREAWREFDTSSFAAVSHSVTRRFHDEKCIWHGCEQRRVRIFDLSDKLRR